MSGVTVAERRRGKGCSCLVLIAGVAVVLAIVFAVNGCSQRQLDSQPHSILVTWSLDDFVDTGHDGKTSLCDPAPGQPAYLDRGTEATLQDMTGHSFGTAHVSRYTSTGVCSSSLDFNNVTGVGPYMLRLEGHTVKITDEDDDTDSVRNANAGLGTIPNGDRSRFYDIGFLP